VREFGQSVWEFARGIARRFWTLIPGGLVAALDLIGHAGGGELAVSGPVFWTVLGLGLFVSGALTYHDLRMKLPGTTASLRGALRRAQEDVRRFQVLLARATERGHYESGERFATDKWRELSAPLAETLADETYEPIRNLYESADDMNIGIEAHRRGGGLVGYEARFQEILDSARAAIERELRNLP
jgi:hypothetical protein